MRRLLLVLALVTAGAAGVGWWGLREYRAPGPLERAAAVVVPRGTQAEVGEALLRAGVIGNMRMFELAARLTARAGALRAAEFLFPAHASLRDVLAVLRTARPVQHRLTIPEGLTAAQEAELFNRTDTLSGDVTVPAEGSLLPGSYSFERGFTREALDARAAAAMRRALARVWGERAEGLPLRSPEELVALASIVERETARPEERAHIAAVFINRLRKGMRLQSDPTVIYAVTGGTMSGGRTLTRADLEMDNPYNTYRAAGLPPGPIGSPGIASLQAVARPATSDDLYFVADGTGGHVFARTLEEHHRNVARWQAGQAH